MRLIKPSIEILEQGSGIQGIYKQIEKAGRTAYKSENYITEGSAEKFVNMIKNKNHGACLEHGTVYLKTYNPKIYYKYRNNQYSKVKIIKYSKTGCDELDLQNSAYDVGFITTNYRVLYENNWLDDLQYLCEPTKYHEKRITVKFILPISISREFCRHRCMSFMEMSTRYCNFNKDKFNNEITFIIPYWSSLKEAKYVYWDGDYVEDTTPESLPHTILKHVVGDNDDVFLSVCENAELCYKQLINSGRTPQEAREVLPLCTKTELIMTGTIEQWKGFFKLRSPLYGATGAHPQAAELADKLYIQFKEKNYI